MYFTMAWHITPIFGHHDMFFEPQISLLFFGQDSRYCHVSWVLGIDFLLHTVWNQARTYIT